MEPQEQPRMTQTNTGNIAAPAPATVNPQEEHAKHSPLVLLIGLAITALVVAMGAYWLMQPQATDATKEPKKIAIAYFRQGLSAKDEFKKAIAEMGYTNIEYVEEEIIIGPTMGEQMTAFYNRVLAEGVDLIWSDHEQQAKVALQITKERQDDTPIVYIIRFHDPVLYGMADSFQSSGNNSTGVAGNLLEAARRTLEFVKEMNPDAKTIGMFGTGFMVPSVAMGYYEELKRQVPIAGFELVEYTTSVPPPQAEAEFKRIAASIEKGDIDAFLHVPGHFYEPQESAEYQLAKELGIIHSTPYEDMPGGGHFSYSSNFAIAGAQSAVMVDKIFRGAEPASIPIEYGARTDLTLHLGRAAETGIQFTDSMLFIAAEKRE